MPELDQVMTEETGLFDDLVETSDTVEESVETDTPTEETSSDTNSFLDIDYMDEVKHLSREEAKTLSQKGMDYDRIRERYDSFKPYTKSIETIERLAKANNMDVDAFMTNLENMQNQFETSRKMEELRNENPDLDDAILERLAKAELGNKRTEEANKPDPIKVEIEKQVEKFEKVYPDVDWGNLPKEVLQDMDNGYTLLEAYQKYERSERLNEINELKTKIGIQEKNERNKAKSLGNMSSDNAVAEDDFLNGFLNS